MPGFAEMNFSVSGTKEIAAKFNALDRKVQRQIINRAGLPILKDMKHTAKQNILYVFAGFRPSRGKNVGLRMAKGLQIRRSTRRGRLRIYLAIKWRRTNKLSHLFEWGFFNVWAQRRLPAYLMLTKAFNKHAPAAIPLFQKELQRMIVQAGFRRGS